MYSQNSAAPVKNFVPTSENVLDRWILARLRGLIFEVTKASDNYELDRAARPVADFVDDLSTWYLRRSRDRFKSGDQKDKVCAVETTRFVLEELSKVIAPVMPFYAEELYQKVKSLAGAESVHLASWPETGALSKAEEGMISGMAEVRKIVTLGLEARSKSLIKVRQPLQSLKIKNQNLKLSESHLDLIKDEINVKEAFIDAGITDSVELDLNITPELKVEGQVRELIRGIQELRKQEKLSLSDIVVLQVKTDSRGRSLIEKFGADIKKATQLKNISYESIVSGTAVKVDDMDFELKIKR
jgi:isoleucyl-tRNA synthetase